MYLIVTRHGHRDASNPILDNGLTEQGQTQAKKISRFFETQLKSKLAGNTLKVFTSSKIRCQQTIAPLCAEHGFKPIVHLGLTEGAADNGKLIDFISDWKKSQNAWTLICSHGDVLPYLFFKLTGQQVALEKGAIALIEWTPETATGKLHWVKTPEDL